MASLDPGLHAAFQRLGVSSSMTKPGGCALAELVPSPADSDDIAPTKIGSPGGDIGPWPANRPRDQARIGGKILVRADVDDDRSVGGANETSKFIDGNRIESRDAASLMKAGRDTSACRLMG